VGKSFTFVSQDEHKDSDVFRTDLDLWAEGRQVVFQASDPWTYGCATHVCLTREQVCEVIVALQELIKED
jgi:hypothetical protein